MPKMTPKRLAEIVTKILADYNEQSNKDLVAVGAKPDDCFKDVRITAEKDHVLITYDGAGYDFLSMESEMSSTVRKLIEDRIKPLRMYIEDRNSWSFHIYMA